VPSNVDADCPQRLPLLIELGCLPDPLQWMALVSAGEMSPCWSTDDELYPRCLGALIQQHVFGLVGLSGKCLLSHRVFVRQPDAILR